jgi:hypothetical protein
MTYLAGAAIALERTTEVVDNNAGAARGKEKGVDLTQATTGTGDDDDLAVVSQLLSHAGICAG